MDNVKDKDSLFNGTFGPVIDGKDLGPDIIGRPLYNELRKKRPKTPDYDRVVTVKKINVKKKSITLGVLLLALAGCSTGVTPKKSPEPSPEAKVESLNEPGIITPDIQGLEPKRVERLNQSVKIVNRILSSKEFEIGVLGFKHAGKPGFYFRSSDKRATPEEVLKCMRTPVSVVYKPLVLSARQKMFGTSAIGATVGTRHALNMNKFDSLKDTTLIAHVAHERAHMPPCQHSHSYLNDANRPFSVAYGIGSIVERIYDSNSENQTTRAP